MAINTTLSPTIIAREALRLLRNNLVMGSLVYRDYESEFPGNPKKGGTVTIRKPVKFTVTKARTRSTSVITENSITLEVATQAHVSWGFEMAQLKLTIEDYSERYLRPACAVLANTVDADLLALYKNVYNSVWQSSFATPSVFMTIGKAMQKMDEEAVPPDDRVVVLNPAAHWGMANALTALYTQEPATKALRKGFLGRIANAEFYMDQNVKVHTVGMFHDSASTWTDAIHVMTEASGQASGIVYCTSNKSIRMVDFKVTANLSLMLRTGDTFSFNNVYAVNPMSGESTGSLRQFVVTADVSARTGTETTTGGIVTVYFEPILLNTGAYKTVSTIPALSNTVYVWHDPGKLYPQNLAFHKNAFALVMVPIDSPSDGSWGATMTDEGFSIRVTKQWSIETDEETCRLDILYGVKTIYPEMAVRISGLEAT